MTFDLKNIKNQIGTLAYETPSLKRYGSMEDFTLNSNGSMGDAMGGTDSPDSITDPTVQINNQPNFNTNFGDTGSPDTANRDISPMSIVEDETGLNNTDSGNAFDS